MILKRLPIMTRLGLFMVALVLALMQVPSPLAFAETDTLYVTPSSSQMNVGTPFTVNIKAFSDTNPQSMSVSGTITYPTDLLQVTSTATSGSDFGNPTITLGNGTVGFSGSRASGQSSLSQIFSITFQAKAAGTANVGFASSSRINGNTTTYKTGSFTITNPNPPAPSPTPTVSTAPKPTVSVAPSPTPTPDTGSSSNQTNTTIVDPSGVVDSVVSTAAYTSSVITWKVNAGSPSSTLTYGTSSTQLDKQATVQKTGDTTFTGSVTGLIPGEQYYFSISGSGAGVQPGTYSGNFITQGYPITITVTENNIAAANAQIQIGSTTYTTHSDGKVTIGLAAGSYTGTITTNTATLSINLAVVEKTIPPDGSAPVSQVASFNLTSSPLSSGPGSATTILLFLGILFGGAAILVFGVLFFINYRRRKFDATGDTYSVSRSQSVIIDDGYTWQQNDAAKPPTTAQLPSDSEDTEITHQHDNAVYLNEEEPLDMFEQARQAHDISADRGAAGQSSSPPHSTTP
jgi:hypothetical protein